MKTPYVSGSKDLTLGHQIDVKHKTDLRMALSKRLMAAAKPKIGRPETALGPAMDEKD